MQLLIINYNTDAERKRIDYAVERWKNEISIEKPRGTVIIVDGREEKINEFLEDLWARLEKPAEDVRVYEIRKHIPFIERKVKTLSYEIIEDIETLKKFIEYLTRKIDARFEGSTKFGKLYKTYTKKGGATLEIIIEEKEDKVKIKIEIEGYGEVVDFISQKIDDEMKIFLGGG